MNSVANAKARSVKGSNVESVRVANDIVNILLAGPSDFIHPWMEKEIRNLLQGVATGEMRRIDR
jgi:hypothetical protein